MQTPAGHLTFCTNIFPGETWEEHFAALQENIPSIKKEFVPCQPFGIGLRLSNEASLQLVKEESLTEFRNWLLQQDCYILCVNGFPYGHFHHTKVKDQVHAPDWTTDDRFQYTLRLFRILAALLPEGMDGGVSTSPLSYKPWYSDEKDIESAITIATQNVIKTVCKLKQIYQNTGKLLHLDIEPEADGLIESSDEFIAWFLKYLIPSGVAVLKDRFSMSETDAEKTIRDHVRLCYDVCHFAVGFEETEEVLHKLKQVAIQVGRWQLSSALKIKFSCEGVSDDEILRELKRFDEPVYLHQVVARKENGALMRYTDLPDALNDAKVNASIEWRSHFHVPLFIKKFGLLESTQDDVLRVIALQNEEPVCNIMEIETYTWDVLPGELKLPVDASVIREMKWVAEKMKSKLT